MVLFRNIDVLGRNCILVEEHPQLVQADFSFLDIGNQGKLELLAGVSKPLSQRVEHCLGLNRHEPVFGPDPDDPEHSCSTILGQGRVAYKDVEHALGMNRRELLLSANLCCAEGVAAGTVLRQKRLGW